MVIFVELSSGPIRGGGKKIFIGRLPQEATVEDLREYFSRFGHITDVYVPKVVRLFYFGISCELLNLAVFHPGSKEDRAQGIWICDLC